MSEVNELIDLTYQKNTTPLQEALNARDRILITIFYCCGLRRNEGSHVQITDINFDTRFLHVKKGKYNRERFVPFNRLSATFLKEYINNYRTMFLKNLNESNLFISSNYGSPMTGGSLYRRLQRLLKRSSNPTLRNKHIGLHSLRHSVATHLLQAGMELNNIQRFLGHTSLESTQIYTHLA
ncbi:tyrosine-type recombinase/integrase [Draconibacterium sp. IB214405]|uniref:tyrosine-type recombinase/integrase n=1 Tax=Draconibacterium sp. IB214405 TaxID=3097352 RepID=UPI003FA4051F